MTNRNVATPKGFKKPERINKVLDRSRVVFHLREGTPLVAFGQTAGGWGRVNNPLSLAKKLFSEDEMQTLREMKLDL